MLMFGLEGELSGSAEGRRHLSRENRLIKCMNVFDEMGKYWAEIADQNQTERQIKFLKGTVKADGLILDLACGTGRHLLELGKAGYDVVGLDISAKLLKIAKSRWHKAQLVKGDMRFLPFKPSVFSAAISMDQSFGYLSSEMDDLQSLKELKKTLRSDGVLIVDLFNLKHLVKKLQKNNEFKWREYPSFFLVQTRNIDSSSGKLHDQWTVYDWVDGDIKVFEHITRLYTCGDMQSLLEKANFIIKEVYGDYEIQNWTEDSKRLIFLAKVI
jgi:SAM-dependent methyltransferase